MACKVSPYKVGNAKTRLSPFFHQLRNSCTSATNNMSKLRDMNGKSMPHPVAQVGKRSEKDVSDGVFYL